MTNPLTSLSGLPTPVKFVGTLACGGGLVLAMMEMRHHPVFGGIVFGGLVVAGLAMAIYVLVLKYKDKVKAGAFLKGVIERSRGGGGGATDPAAKAKLDDLRKKFEEGVETFKQNGKDLYSLPWYVLVGPSGSGKTEAMRHCQIGYPPGLQDCLQGAGGTLNMHWWFSNNAVVIDTAGRMFMQEAQAGGTSEWKEFLKLLRQVRPNCPINGMLLVISSESLLKDSAEKIEETAGAIARQLDVIQRTLEVRFPVYVVITKCDKIVGFREFFERIDDPTLQHQMLGWSNPASLDEVFKAETVDKHLDGVKEKLMRRRMALLQDPTHTTDPSARRTDQVDELFELPDNLTRIAPRLRRYLEMIFMAGEWSPKPLFLRGIYFTSSMREGQALDTSLAGVLGVDVESLPGGRQWDREKSYFLRDVFLSKVFKEKGLVTRAMNVSEQIRKRRRVTLGVAVGAAVALVGVTALGFVSFRGTVRTPSAFWQAVDEAYESRRKDLMLIATDSTGKAVTYLGNDELKLEGDLGGLVRRKRDVIIETGARSTEPVSAKVLGISLPFLGGSTDGYVSQQARAHRALVESTLLKPLIVESQAKLEGEREWGEEAVAALAELIRIQTYAEGFLPAEATGSTVRGGKPRSQVEADAFVRYLLTEGDYRNAYDGKDNRDQIQLAVDRAYKSEPWGKDSRPSTLLVWEPSERLGQLTRAIQSFVNSAKDAALVEGTKLWQLNRLSAALKSFTEAESKLHDLAPLRAGASPIATIKDHDRFAADARAQREAMKQAKEEADRLLARLCPAGSGCDLSAMYKEECDKRLTIIRGAFARFADQLPTVKDNEKSEHPLVVRAKSLTEDAKLVADSADRKLSASRAEFEAVAVLCVAGVSDGKPVRAYAARFDAYQAALAVLEKSVEAQPPTEPGVYRPLATDMDAAAAEIEDANAVTRRTRAWQADGAAKITPEQTKALSDARERACGVSDLIIGVSKRRWDAELVKAFLKGMPSDSKALAEMLKNHTETRIAVDSPDEEKWKAKARPPLPLTAMSEGPSIFDHAYHPNAGRLAFRDWDRVSQVMTAPAGQAAALGAAENRQEFERAQKALTGYAITYACYWRDVLLLRDSSAVYSKWSDLAPKLRELKAWQAQPVYKELSEEASRAHAAITASLANNAEIKRAIDDSADAVRMIDDKEYNKKRDATIALWSELAGKTAKDARTTLRSAIGRDGSEGIGAYFEIYDRTGPHVHYWNEVIERTLDALIKETAGDILSAKTFLTEECKAVPLALGPSERELTVDQLKRAKAAADSLGIPGHVSAGSQPGPDIKGGLPKNIKDKLASLQGDDFLRTESAKQWMRSMKAAVALLSTPNLRLAINGTEIDRKPSHAAPGANSVNQNSPYVQFVTNGQPGKWLVRSDRGVPDPTYERTLPASCESLTLVLYKNDNFQNQSATIDLPGPWPLLREMQRNYSPENYDATDKSWLVPIVKGDQYLWLKISFVVDGKPVSVPPPSEWPDTTKWP